MPTKLDNLNAIINVGLSMNANVNEAGFSSPLNFVNNQQKRITLGTSAANNAANGSDELYATMVTVGASSSQTLTISNLTDVLGQTSLAFVRVKALYFQLLSPTDDVVNGTLATSVTVGNAASNVFNMELGVAGTYTGNPYPTFTLLNGDVKVYATGSAAGVAVASGSSDKIKITNNDAGLSAKVIVIIVGASS